jgi:hypothetical protein
MTRTAKMTASGRAAVEYAGPPAERMQGRPSRNALTAKATKATTTATAPPQTHTARESLLDRAVHAGVISQGTRPHYAQAYDADPDGTKAFLDSIGLRAQAGGPPPAAVAASASDSYDPAMLSDGERARIAAAGEGRQHTHIISGGL